jgi:DNA-directed RNA polymerase specialized sigma24 family protein
MSEPYIRPARAISQYYTKRIKESSLKPISRPRNKREALILKLYEYVVRDYSLLLRAIRPITIKAANAIGAIHRSLKRTTADGRREIVDQFLSDRGIMLLDQYAPTYSVRFYFFLTCFLNWKKDAYRYATTKQQRFEEAIVSMGNEFNEVVAAYDNNNIYVHEAELTAEVKLMSTTAAFHTYCQTLRELDRLLLEASLLKGMTSEQIAEIIDWDPSSVRHRKAKLMKDFRASLTMSDC